MGKILGIDSVAKQHRTSNLGQYNHGITSCYECGHETVGLLGKHCLGFASPPDPSAISVNTIVVVYECPSCFLRQWNHTSVKGGYYRYLRYLNRNIGIVLHSDNLRPLMGLLSRMNKSGLDLCRHHSTGKRLTEVESWAIFVFWVVATSPNLDLSKLYDGVKLDLAIDAKTTHDSTIQRYTSEEVKAMLSNAR